MHQAGKFRDILQAYGRHGWRLARVLVGDASLDELRREAAARGESVATFEGIAAQEVGFDAMWFTRPAQGGREAWELRLVGDVPYALFEMFEPDEAEEDREQVRREMEEQMREKVRPERERGGG